MDLNSWIEDFCNEVRAKIQKNYDLVDQLRITDRREKSSNNNRVGRILGCMDREVSVRLFEQFKFGHKKKELQIWIKFSEVKSDKDSGFTKSRSEAIRLTIDWLSHKQNYQQIYQQHKFLGGPERQIKDLKGLIFQETLKYKNQLEEGKFKLKKNDRFVLLATTDIFGSSTVLIFFYKEIRVFEYKPGDVKVLIRILDAWFDQKWSPEKIKESFTGIESVRHKELFLKWKWITKRKIRFIKSWDAVERFYSDQVIRTFINDLRRNNYDHKTRAGNVLGRLVISRSKEYGLRANQKSISFDFNPIGPSLTMNTIDRRRLNFDEVQCNDAIKKECMRLLKEPIN